MCFSWYSQTTLIQICGRAARNVDGRVILYADKMTGSMQRALSEMNRRRVKQLAYNLEHHVTPKTIVKAVHDLDEFQYKAKEEGLVDMMAESTAEYMNPKSLPGLIEQLERQMREAADNLDFETAAALRDRVYILKEMGAGKRK
jgi:excinuclease ABC subunit B